MVPSSLLSFVRRAKDDLDSLPMDKLIIRLQEKQPQQAKAIRVVMIDLLRHTDAA